MMALIMLNTGLFVKRGQTDLNDAIVRIGELPVQGIEIGTSFLDLLMEFRLSQKSYDILKKMKYVSLHAPVNFYYRNDKYTQNVLDKLKQVYQLVDAKYVVFHPHSIQDCTLVRALGLKCSLENDRAIYKKDASAMSALVHGHDTSFVLDTSHALSFSDEEVGKLIGLLKDRLVACHLSMRKDGRDHTPLHLCQEELGPLEPVKGLDCPFVLECWHTYQDEIEDEINFVNAWLER